MALQLSGAARILIRALGASTIAMGEMMDLGDGMGSRPVKWAHRCAQDSAAQIWQPDGGGPDAMHLGDAVPLQVQR